MARYSLALLCLLGLVLSSRPVVASTIVPVDAPGDAATTFQAGASGQVLTVAPPNSEGISINRFAHFTLDAPLDIVSLHGPSATQSAHLIVIQSERIVLGDTVHLVGPKADLLFMATGTGGAPDPGASTAALVCDPCRFDNVYRVLLAAAESTGYQDLTTRQGGGLYLGDVAAPGALAVDVLARSVQLAGQISTHQRVQVDAHGGYRADANGSLRMGGGAVNVYTGDLLWHRASRQVRQYGPGTTGDGLRTRLAGAIHSTSVSLVLAGPATVRTAIDTRSDRLSALRYRGQLQVNDEQVIVQNLAPEAGTDRDLILASAIHSDGRLTVRSSGALQVLPSARLQPADGALMAVGDVQLQAPVQAFTLRVAGHHVHNSGEVLVHDRLELSAEGDVVNGPGGALQGDTLVLTAEQGLVRNGSLNAERRAPLLDTGSLYTGHPAYEGTAFNASVGRLYPPLASARATIDGNRVHITARAVENINPYYSSQKDSQQHFLFDAGRYDQVRIAAEQELLVRGGDYLWNASAILQVNSPFGVLSLQAATVRNERYLSLHTLNKNGARYSTDTVLHSPPGRLVAFGQLAVDSQTDFVSHNAYVEVFGTARFTRNIIAQGLGHQRIAPEEGRLSAIPSRLCGSELNNGVPVPGLDCRASTTQYAYGSAGVTVLEDTRAIDALFYLDGALEAPNSAVDFHKKAFLGVYKDAAVAAHRTALFNLGFGGGTILKRWVQVVDDPVTRTVTLQRYRDFSRLMPPECRPCASHCDPVLCQSREETFYNQPYGDPVRLTYYTLIHSHYRQAGLDAQAVRAEKGLPATP